MAHLSSLDRPWGKSFTNKLYIHPPFAENIVTLWPNSMVMIGEIPSGNSRYWYQDEKYGNRWTWYTTWAEHSRYTYYKRSGNREKCKELLDALLKYNVTTEYCQCERYDDHDAYTAPWMPNASANGRVLDMLFDYYGKKAL